MDSRHDIRQENSHRVYYKDIENNLGVYTVLLNDSYKVLILVIDGNLI